MSRLRVAGVSFTTLPVPPLRWHDRTGGSWGHDRRDSVPLGSLWSLSLGFPERARSGLGVAGVVSAPQGTLPLRFRALRARQGTQWVLSGAESARQGTVPLPSGTGAARRGTVPLTLRVEIAPMYAVIGLDRTSWARCATPEIAPFRAVLGSPAGRGPHLPGPVNPREVSH
jgi:hypothetical protein